MNIFYGLCLSTIHTAIRSSKMNLADPELEFIDPTPNVHSLFVHFDDRFFWKKLARVEVRWSKRMYSCAGVCRYDTKNGYCDIALSEPLLKLRPRKDLVETLLHEMIHAFLFVTNNDRDRDGHGPNFQKHMHRINKAANVNISIYHDFHDEVKLYQTHWWRCDGPCQHRKPFFGMVQRSYNRAPGPSDFWWAQHKASCGGTFIKVKEPDKKTKHTQAQNSKENIVKLSKTSNIKTFIDLPSTSKIFPKSNTFVTTEKPTETSKGVKPHTLSTINKPTPDVGIMSDKGKTLTVKENNKNENVVETVRNIWANKSINALNKSSPTNQSRKRISTNSGNISKIPKIDSYFSSTPKKPNKEKINEILKEVYGEDFTLSNNVHYKSDEVINSDKQVLNNEKLQGQNNGNGFVQCPVCNKDMKISEINDHIDLCLIKSNSELTDCEVIDLTNLETSIISNDSNNKIEVKGKTNSGANSTDIYKKIEVIELPDIDSKNQTVCPVCNKKVKTSMEEHLDACLSCFKDDKSIPEEGNSLNSSCNQHSSGVSFEDEEIDESSEFNVTGTMYPCPCCLTMVEKDMMNSHLDTCLVDK